MSGKGKRKLGVPLNASEMELLQKAALSAGQQDVSAWAKDVLLTAAESQVAKEKGDPVAPGKKKAARPRPQCTCGATSNPNGECDGSCIMRF